MASVLCARRKRLGVVFLAAIAPAISRIDLEQIWE